MSPGEIKEEKVNAQKSDETDNFDAYINNAHIGFQLSSPILKSDYQP